MGKPNDYEYVAYLNRIGEVIEAQHRTGTDLVYDEEEKERQKTVKGARLYNPNGCCWRIVAGVWKCRDRYCS